MNKACACRYERDFIYLNKRHHQNMESVQSLAAGARVIVARGALQGLLARVVAIGSDARVEIDVFLNAQQVLARSNQLADPWQPAWHVLRCSVLLKNVVLVELAGSSSLPRLAPSFASDLEHTRETPAEEPESSTPMHPEIASLQGRVQGLDDHYLLLGK
jgi:hypothetical protein